MIEIELYETENKRCPAREFIKELSPKHRAKVSTVIALLEEFGTIMRKPHSAPLRDGIFELRVSHKGSVARILFFYYGDKAVLTHGFVKKTNKTPLPEIERAKRYMQNYVKRSS